MNATSQIALPSLPKMMARSSVTVNGRPEMTGCFYDCALYLLVRLPKADAAVSWIDTQDNRMGAAEVAQAYELGRIRRP